MGEHHDRPGALGQGEVTGQYEAAGVHLDRGGPPGGSGPGAGCGSGSRPCQQGDDLLVGGLGEVLVPLADGAEGAWCGEAHHLVGLGAQPGHRVRRRHRNGQHHARRALRPYDFAGGRGRGPGRDPVVHHDHGPAVEVHPRTVAAEAPGLPGELGLLGVLDRHEIRLPDPAAADDVLADDPYAALADGAEPQLTVVRDAELAHHDHIQRGAERLCHREGHRNSAAGQAQDDGILPLQVAECFGETLSGVRAMGEQHEGSPPNQGRRKPRTHLLRRNPMRGPSASRPAPVSELIAKS